MFIVDPVKVKEINDKLDELFIVYDGRLLAAVLMNRTASTYATLHSLGCENPESLERLFKFGLDIAKAPPEIEPKVVYEGQPINTKQ
jgi:hypothetical protein